MRLQPLRALRPVAILSLCILGSWVPCIADAANGSWTGGDGNWSDSSHWAAGVVADGADSQARFNFATGPFTVSVDTPRTIGELLFDSDDQPTLAGPEVLTLDRTSGSPTITIPLGYFAFTTVSAALAGNDGLTIDAELKHLSLSAQNLYSGPTTVQTGTVRAVDGVGLPSASNLVFATTNSAFRGILESNGTFSRSLGTAPGQVQWTGSGGFAAFGGPLAVSLDGGGTVTWDTGNFVPAGEALGLGSLWADNVVDFQNPIDLNGAPRVILVRTNDNSPSDHIQISGAISNGDLQISNNSGATKLVLTGANSYGQTSMAFLTLQIGDGGTTGTLGTGDITGTGTLAFNRSDAVNVPNTISGRISIVQDGTGVTTLSGTTTHAGPTEGATTVNAGTLLVTGSLTGMQVNVTAGTLGGTGTVTTGDKAFMVAAGGKLAPGTSAGTLTVNTGNAALDVSGAVTAANSQSLLFELATPGSSDQVLLTGGTLSIGAGLLEFDDFAFSTLGGFGEGTYTLFDGVSPIDGTLGPNITGTISGYSVALAITDGGNDLVLVVPEPATLTLLAVGLASVVFVQKRACYKSRSYRCRGEPLWHASFAFTRPAGLRF